MTKSDRIMALHAQGLSTRQIAERVYGINAKTSRKLADRKMAYVRIVVRQRQGGSKSPADTRYWRKESSIVLRRQGARRRGAAGYYKRKYQLELRRRALAESTAHV